MIRIGTRVTMPYRLRYITGTVIKAPFHSVKGWNRVFAWVKWDNGFEESVMKRYLTRVDKQ